jgi:hypothetical protein
MSHLEASTRLCRQHDPTTLSSQDLYLPSCLLDTGVTAIPVSQWRQQAADTLEESARALSISADPLQCFRRTIVGTASMSHSKDSGYDL